MRTILRKFDEIGANVIGVLPKSLYRAFDLLCIVIRPSTCALAVAIVALIAYYSGQSEWLWSGVATLVMVPLSTIAKFATRRPRPVSMYTDAMKIKSYSFPSSHAYGAMLAGGFVSIFLISVIAGPLAYVLTTAVMAIVVIVGAARVYLGAHFPSDVLGGFLLAIVVLSGVIAMFNLEGF